MASDGSGGIREWMNRGAGKAIAILAGLALIGGAAWVFVTKSSGMEEKRAQIRNLGRRVDYICKGCWATGKMHVTWDETFPTTCPECKAKKAVLGFKCTRGRCRQIFVKVESPRFVCPYCGMEYERMGGQMLRPPGAPPSSGAPPSRN